MKKLILLSLLAVSAGQLYGAAGAEGVQGVESSRWGENAEWGNPEWDASYKLLLAVGNGDKDTVVKMIENDPSLVDTDDGTFSPLGLAQRLASTAGDAFGEPEEEPVMARAQEIVEFLRSKGATKVFDELDKD